MSDLEFLDDTEQDVSESHYKLLEAVSQLDKGQRVKKAERNEPTLEVSEFHLVKSGISDKDAVRVHDLAKVLGRKGHHLDIAKSLEAAKKKKVNVLQKPLEKPAADRIKRITGFENTKTELKKWNAIITKHRVAKTLHFPLNQSSLRLEPTKQFVNRFRIQSELEKELAALEPQKENIEEKDDEFSLTLKEIVMKRKEAARVRAQQSYREAKARRQNKIKSKKFHRVQRKQRIKVQLKEFEELQKTNPEAALEKLEQLDKTRAEERMSLRHKSTGQWAKSKQVRAKYDKETRQELAQQLKISRELSQKIRKPNDSEEEGENGNASIQSLVTDKENPWVGNIKTGAEIDEFVTGYRKYWDEQNKKLQNQELDGNNKGETEIKQDSHPLPTFKGQNIVHNIETPEIQDHKKATKRTISNKSVTSSDTPKLPSNFEEQDMSYDVESFKIQDHKEETGVAKSNDEKITHGPSNRTAKRKASDDNKRSNKSAKLQKKNLNKIRATSAWNVESVENDDAQNVFDLSKLNIPNTDQISKMFDIAEEKMQDQIKSKFERVAEKYNRVAKKQKMKKSVQFKEVNEFDGLEIQATNHRPILDIALDERVNDSSLDLNTESNYARSTEYNNNLPPPQSDASKTEIDPNKYINVKPKHLNTALPADITGGDDALDDSENEDEKHNVISEAFADDDVVEEFRKEKQEEVEKSKPKDIDLTLPGWGSWGGKNVKVSKRKKKRFILKFPKDLPRKDENKGDVIIFEEENAKIKEHQVTELPYPFTSVKDYESSVRMPIGRNFVTENAHRKLIAPAVETKLGEIIEPMSEDVLVKMEEKKRRKSTNKNKSKLPKKKKVK